jgi:hypothetical protein
MRLLNAIHDLHRQGYQNLACYFSTSPSGFHWRLELKHFDDLYINLNGDIYDLHTYDAEQTLHSSGQNGNDYFGWDDAKNANAYQLAELIKRRFPRLLAQCKGSNFEYVGWFVYMLGQAELERLPVFFLEYNDPQKGKIFSTESQVLLTAPPHQKLNKKGDKEWLWLPEIDISKDWHTAYQPIIDELRGQELRKYPKYPSQTDDLFEHGAYWEGAIYYLKTVMNYSNEATYINERINTTTRWEEFELIYNSEGQLHLLDAYLAQVALKYYKSEMSAQTVKNCYQSFDDIKLLYRETPYLFPNPYFGGNNPLHLTSLCTALS